MRKQYEKLVRDQIPELIEKDGGVPSYTVLSKEDYEKALRWKLCEEAAEYQYTGEAEELADLLEVIEAICRERGITWADLTALKVNKLESRGGFRERILLHYVDQ